MRVVEIQTFDFLVDDTYFNQLSYIYIDILKQHVHVIPILKSVLKKDSDLKK